MAITEFSAGQLVRHTGRPDWDLGKVLQVQGNKVRVFFKGDAEKDVRTLIAGKAPLDLAASQSDPQLDNLPPLQGDDFGLKAGKVTLSDGLRRFSEIFPRGFQDPDYIGSGKAGGGEAGEREYKWRAHELYVELLGEGRGQALLDEGDVEEVAKRVLQVEGKTNLLSQFEKMALRDGLADPAAARAFLGAIFAFIADGSQERFEAAADALRKLPVEAGKAKVATWPVLTLLPFLARPDRFMFLKPEPTKECAERLRFALQYDSDLRWITWKKLMVMADEQLGPVLREQGARDYIDIQSFIWVIAKY